MNTFSYYQNYQPPPGPPPPQHTNLSTNTVQHHPLPSDTMSTFSLPSPAHTVSAPTRPPLTQTLINSSPFAFELTTQSPFLIAAGRGRVSKTLLSRWLSQNRLSAQSCIGFIGSLIARVDLPHVSVSDKSSSLRWKMINLLTSALLNVQRELDFFASVARRYSIDLDAPPRQDVYFAAARHTKQYIDLYRVFWTDPSMALMEGLVILWARGHVCLTAWKFAKEGLANPDSRREDDLDGGALRQEFIPNWTSPEYERFIADVAEVMNEFAEREDAYQKLDVYKAVWGHVLEIERRFWPEM